MDEAYLQCPSAGPVSGAIAPEVFLREEPQEHDEEDDEQDTNDEKTNDGDEGYSE